MVEVEGKAVKPFEGVKKAFRENFKRRNEVGADFCVYYENEPVVDIWGGYKDEEKENEWDQDTLVPVFSTTKAVSAACLALLNSRGLLDYDEKVSTYWPEFGQNGKEDVTVNQLLQHRAGLSAIDRKLTPEIIANQEKLDEILAEQEPGWEPGTQQGYHVWTIGWYMSALLSRVDPEGRRLSEFVREEINEEVDAEFYIGIDDDFDMERIAMLIPLSKLKGMFAMPLKFVKEFFKPWSLTFKS
ncbi:beta-lactamase family protein, partial [Candidatus Bipolaricaulota bacterium]|nr:beta-lactamase family protein [Candidatus Bipolaricaulota bacterium]